MSSASSPARRRSSTVALIAAATIAVLAVVGGLIGAASNNPGSGTASVSGTALNGKHVTLDLGESADAARKSNAVAATGDRLRVPSAGLDVPLGALDAVDGQITPPGFQEAYVVRNMGTTLADRKNGTVFLVMHSLRGGAIGPGNYLIDVDKQRSDVAVGSAVHVGDATYTVTGSHRITKKTIADDAATWADVPGRLVLITCLQRPDGSASVDNVLIEATLQP
jgi:hypothetical protein